MPIFKLLHILAMFAAVTFLVGEALLYGRAILRKDVPGLAAVRRLVGGRPILGVGFLILGIVFGVLAAVTGGFDVLAGWLVAAYVLVAVLIGLNATPWVQRLPQVGAAAVEAEEGRGSPDGVLRQMIELRSIVVVAVGLNVILFVAIVADMVLKPF